MSVGRGSKRLKLVSPSKCILFILLNQQSTMRLEALASSRLEGNPQTRRHVRPYGFDFFQVSQPSVWEYRVDLPIRPENDLAHSKRGLPFVSQISVPLNPSNRCFVVTTGAQNGNG